MILASTKLENLLKLKMLNLWDKHKKESKQTVVIVGFVILSVKLCKVDGIFTDIERQEILDIIPHEPEERKFLLEIIKEAEQDDHPIAEDTAQIVSLLGRENRSFFEFIVANLVRLAKVDKMVSQEVVFIERIAREFELDKNPIVDLFQPIINYISNKRLEISTNA